MYVWLWQKLPGNVGGKLGGCLLLFLIVTALLFFVVFPYAEPLLPFDNITVDPK